jgi:hypothetical protein
MILKELQNYILNKNCVSLAEMKQHFGIDGDALKPMLDKLIKKGRVKKLPTAEKCHSCTGCDHATLEFYEWVVLIASLARQLFIQLKKQQPLAVTESNNSNNSHDSNLIATEIEASEADLQGYAIAHAVPGRVRLKIPQLAIDADFARRLQQALNADEYVQQVRINRPAASIAINYSNQGLSDWELGLRLMNIINTLREEHQVSV